MAGDDVEAFKNSDIGGTINEAPFTFVSVRIHDQSSTIYLSFANRFSSAFSALHIVSSTRVDYTIRLRCDNLGIAASTSNVCYLAIANVLAVAMYGTLCIVLLSALHRRILLSTRQEYHLKSQRQMKARVNGRGPLF